MSTETLGQFLREVSNWDWAAFLQAEHDPQYTSNQAMIFALIRSCAMEKMDAIKMSLNRLDGKLKTPIKVEYPKVYYRYPNATLEDAAPRLEEGVIQGEIVVTESDDEEVVDVPSLSLRQTLTRMSDYPRELPQTIIDRAQAVDMAVRGQGAMPADIPHVKSVVAAHLLMMAQGRNVAALDEVFNQIDGKLAETIQILGQDIHITSYLPVAPPGAYLNDEGVVEIEATMVQDLWASKLGAEVKRMSQ